MDKLQPILKHQFWILLVPLLSLTIWGYVSTNGKLRAATTTREDDLKKALSSIPKGATDPNQKYIDGLQKHNELLEKYVKEELDELWVRQLPRMVWPEIVQPGIPEAYKGPITDIQTRENYRTEYDKIIDTLHQSVEPFVANKSLVTWTEKVDFPISLIPRARRWHLTPPEKEIWEAQEDVWLTQLILDAIRDMNKDADSAQSAVVRKVIKYQLLGGNGESSVGATAGVDGSSGSPEMMTSPEMPMSGSPFGGGNAASGMSKPPAIKFDPQEEFGTGGIATAGGFGGGMPVAMDSGSGSGDPSGTGAEPVEILRYVKEDTAAPFVERGFYLSVIIHQTKMVEFLARLQNSDWPIRITRFHFGKNPYAPALFGGPGAGGAGGAGGFSPSSGFSPSMMESPSLVPESSDYSSPDSGLFGGGGSSSFAGPGAAGGNTGYPKTAIESADLIQLDLCGLITMYRQPAPATTTTAPATATTTDEAASPAPAAETPAADGSAPATETPATPTEGAPTEGALPEAAPATPEGTPAPVEGAETTPPAEEPATPATEPAVPASEGAPAPTETPATPAEPAAP